MNVVKLFLSLLLLVGAATSQALEVTPYSATALAAAQKADKPVALHFRADWCTTCRAQDRALQSLKNEAGLDITVLSVNYDTEKALKQRFHVTAQSTLVILKGETEITRSVADTSKLNMLMALKSAL
jgi:thioredoxin 1